MRGTGGERGKRGNKKEEYKKEEKAQIMDQRSRGHLLTKAMADREEQTRNEVSDTKLHVDTLRKLTSTRML